MQGIGYGQTVGSSDTGADGAGTAKSAQETLVTLVVNSPPGPETIHMNAWIMTRSKDRSMVVTCAISGGREYVFALARATTGLKNI